MKSMRKHLEQLRRIKREKHHHLIHKIHKKHKISKKTLFYVKEYGPHSNIPKTIIRESIKILLLASIMSSIGGLALEHIKLIFLSIMPLIIIAPTLNDMVGDYGTIVSSRFSTMLHEGKIKGRLWKNREVRALFTQIFVVAMITAVISAVIALVISALSGYAISKVLVYKILLIDIVDVAFLVAMLFGISMSAGLFFYRRGEDPNNYLIPITTSLADFGNMIILAILVVLFF